MTPTVLNSRFIHELQSRKMSHRMITSPRYSFLHRPRKSSRLSPNDRPAVISSRCNKIHSYSDIIHNGICKRYHHWGKESKRPKELVPVHPLFPLLLALSLFSFPSEKKEKNPINIAHKYPFFFDQILDHGPGRSDISVHAKFLSLGSIPVSLFASLWAILILYCNNIY